MHENKTYIFKLQLLIIKLENKMHMDVDKLFKSNTSCIHMMYFKKQIQYWGTILFPEKIFYYNLYNK